MNTLADLHEQLRRYIGNDTSPTKSAAVVAAAKAAIERIGVYHDWLFFQTWGRTVTVAPYSTGTVVFDFTGGASERLITLTGGTFPDWVSDGATLSINNVPYDVDKLLSATTLTLKVNQTPGMDVAATAYNLYKARYDLPEDLAAIDRPILTSSTRIIPKCSLDEFVMRRNFNESPAEPMMFAIATNSVGRAQLLLWQAPDQVYSLEYQYKRKAAIPRLAEESRGKVALTSGVNTVTGTGTAFTEAMIGCVLRVSANNEVPTGLDGTKPYQSEYLIEGVTSATQMTIVGTADETVSGRGLTISSRLDVDEGPMYQLVIRMGQKNLRISLRINNQNEEVGEYERAVQEAKTFDGQRYKGRETAQRVIAGTRPWGYMKTVQ